MNQSNIITVKNTNFGYTSKELVLKDVNLNVPTGSIYGFLGANGAGKTTTIRNILGLLKPKSGEIKIFNKPLNSSKPGVYKNVGSLIESPSLYPQLNAIDNLKIACKYQSASKGKIEQILHKVKLYDARKKASKNYSTGMKQRLGLGIALLHDPDLLVLDEPTSGLDPMGISEIRQIIVDLKEEGKTILLSSHLLSEIEKMATHVGIIQKGQMIFEGSMDDLNDLKTTNLTLQIRSNNIEKIKPLVEPEMIRSIDNDLITLKMQNENDIPALLRSIIGNQIDVYEAKLLKSDLEKMFIEITNNDPKDQS